MAKTYTDENSSLPATVLTGSNSADNFDIYRNGTTALGRSGDDVFTAFGPRTGPITSGLTALKLDGANGNDSFDVVGTNDTLIGGSGDDRFNVRGAGHHIDGGNGADQIIVEGNATVVAGDGDDTLHLNAFAVSADGGRGKDSFELSYALQTTISGGTGNDMVEISADMPGGAFVGSSSFLLGDGDDEVALYGSVLDVTVDGGKGRDAIHFYGDAGRISGATGDDVIDFGGHYNYVDGGDGNDRLIGGGLVDCFMRGGRGNDEMSVIDVRPSSGVTLDGESGDDFIGGYTRITGSSFYGGDGNDIFTFFQLTRSIVEGGAGNDIFNLIDGAYTGVAFKGGSGDDHYQGNAGISNVHIIEESGLNGYVLNANQVTIETGRDFDAVYLSGYGNKVESGSAGLGRTDVIANGGTLTFVADGAYDTLSGRLQQATIQFGAGYHIVQNTYSQDSFVFTDSKARGVVALDYQAGDTLDIRALHLSDQQLSDAIAHGSRNVLALSAQDGTSYVITFASTDVHNLHVSDFIH